MARVTRFTEEFDIIYTSTPISGYESQTTLADEETPLLLKSTELAAKPKTTTKALTGAIKALKRVTAYSKYRINELVTCNFRQSNAHHDDDEKSSIEAGSISSSSCSISCGAPLDFDAEIRRYKRQSKQYCVDKVFYISPDDDDESSTFTAYKVKKQPTTTATTTATTTTKAQATAESRTPDAPTVWAQAYAPTGYQSEVERIENDTKATVEFLGIEIEIEA